MSARQRKKEARQKAEQQRWLDAHNAAKYKAQKMAEIPKWLMDQYEKEVKTRIEKLKKQVDANGIVSIPFVCYLCDKEKSDFALVSGDGCPICEECITRQVNTITGNVNAT